MSNTSANNKRIAKNTLFMYFRMFITMFLGLYTSRVILKTLGIEDYGLYNVIGGIIAMFGFLNGAMTNTTSRYITFYLGKQDQKSLNKIFSMAFIIHFSIALIILIFGETLGLWYLNNKLVLPEDRLNAAFWLYQLSIISAIVNILYVPFNATIVAHEKMSTFAYISIVDSILKLLIAISIGLLDYDKLITYGFLMFCISLFNICVYYLYCKKHFEETSFHWFWNKDLFKEMFGFAGWSVLGNFSYVFYNQGINLILNAFCGPAVNAARGVAVQVDSIIKQFAHNVQTAINPQIIKSYAEKEFDRMYGLICSSSKFCFYLLLLLSLPVILETEFILKLWLGDFPDHTINFIRITLINVILDTLINPMFTANLASGKVKIYQIVVSMISYGFMPITYMAMKITGIPEVVFLCLLLCSTIGVIARVFIMRHQIGLKGSYYMGNVVKPISSVAVSSILFPIAVCYYLPSSLLRFFLTSIITFFSVCFFVLFLGVNESERSLIYSKIKKKIRI